MTLSMTLEDAFLEHRPFLWSVAYRLTGCAADADDLVQDTFVRALASPPRDTGRPWRPWLTRVLMNLGRDLLRRRRRRGYVGPWLPSPVETGSMDEPPSFDPPDMSPGASARYDLLESVSVAFLLALEALTPAQRGVLLLRDVLDYSVRETASALGMSEANVKTSHSRARRAMEAYDSDRKDAGGERGRTGPVLERFLGALGRGDAAALEALLASDVRMSSDGGGEFVAARRVVVGREKVARFLLGLRAKVLGSPKVAVTVLNGLPAAVVSGKGAPPGWASLVAIQIRVNAEGALKDVGAVLASRKLTALIRAAG